MSNVHDVQSRTDFHAGTHPLFHDVIGMIGHFLHYCKGI